jgi:hypothetical protein
MHTPNRAELADTVCDGDIANHAQSRTVQAGSRRPGSVCAVELWWDYRRVWARHPLLLIYFVIVIAALVLAIYGTVTRTGALALLFIPSLAGGYAHHLMVMKRLDS